MSRPTTPQTPPVFAISGEKNSGKTTLIEGVTAILSARGYRIAVIKHDGHSFEPDVSGTDTRRFYDAGAVGTAVFDGEKYMLVERRTVDETRLFEAFPDADLILIEGLKGSSYPKLFLKAGEWQNPAEVAALLETMLANR
ncbi:MAG: molybdopterin-guanine dinucleotide biosynthesis protein B [Clostridia bacterium]|nr:molybdopterin-guanine dinucleotide biosynthesis protein B [Clostridia bacterium]